MSPDILKTLTVSLTSSLCTALFVVACTAGADKLDEDDDDWDNDGTTESEPPDVGFGDDGDDEGLSSEELAELTATVAAQQEAIVALEEFQASSLCFIGHMLDETQWTGRHPGQSDYPGTWRDIIWSAGDGGEDPSGAGSGQATWSQGPNADSMKAYEDCF